MRNGHITDIHGHPCSGAALLEIQEQEDDETVVIPCEAGPTFRAIGRIGTPNISFETDENGILAYIAPRETR